MLKKLKGKVTLVNIISNIILQIANIIACFIIPKIILAYFGSEVNGLVSSITQFLSYISLVEGGITGVVMATMYKPLIENDYEKISSIILTSNKFYKKIGMIYIIYCLCLSIVYPMFVKTEFSYMYVLGLVMILSISLLIQYMYSLTLRNLLNADKKGYIVSLTQSAILILTVIFSYVSVIIYPSVHILKLISGLLFILQPIIYNSYVKKNYPLKKDVKEDRTLLKERWNGFAINVAAFIHNSTDITLLTLFTNLATVSVYSVYSIVTVGLKSIVNAISNAIVPIIGAAYAAGDEENLNEKLDLYEYIIFIVVFLFFTIAALLITPFVLIYTGGVGDTDYNQPLFGILIVVSEALYLIKYAHLNLAYTANKYKELTVPAFIEAFINIFVSLVLIMKCGLIGVAIGTICGMIYRMCYQVYYSTKLLHNRPQYYFYKKLLLFTIATIIGLLISYNFIPSVQYNFMSFIIHGGIYLILFGMIYAILSVMYFKKEIRFIKKYILRK